MENCAGIVIKKKKKAWPLVVTLSQMLYPREHPERWRNTDALQIITEEHNPEIGLLNHVISFRKPEGRNLLQRRLKELCVDAVI